MRAVPMWSRARVNKCNFLVVRECVNHIVHKLHEKLFRTELQQSEERMSCSVVPVCECRLNIIALNMYVYAASTWSGRAWGGWMAAWEIPNILARSNLNHINLVLTSCAYSKGTHKCDYWHTSGGHKQTKDMICMLLEAEKRDNTLHRNFAILPCKNT